MRITNKTLVKTFLNNLNTNLTNMSKYQDQLSSGKEIRKPSDDPYAVVRSMELNSAIDRNDQYLRNIEDSTGWLDVTDTALGQITDSMQRIKELMISSASGTKTQTDINANKMEIIQKIEEIAQSGNTVFDGKYIFAGNETTTLPFENMGNGNIEYSDIKTPSLSSEGPVNREIAQGVSMQINVSAKNIMTYKDKSGAQVDLAQTLNSIVSDLSEGGDLSNISGDLLEKMETHIDNILRYRGEAGAKSNRMESAKAKNEEETYNTTEILSKIEDIDVAEKYMEYSVMESVYQASLSSSAKILQPSLMDFLS